MELKFLLLSSWQSFITFPAPRGIASAVMKELLNPQLHSFALKRVEDGGYSCRQKSASFLHKAEAKKEHG